MSGGSEAGARLPRAAMPKALHTSSASKPQKERRLASVAQTEFGWFLRIYDLLILADRLRLQKKN